MLNFSNLCLCLNALFTPVLCVSEMGQILVVGFSRFNPVYNFCFLALFLLGVEIFSEFQFAEI